MSPLEEERRPEPVSAATVPLLGLGLVLGFFGGTLLGWWGAVVVAIVLIAALSAVLGGRSRVAAGAAAIGVVVGYVAIMLVAAFRGLLW